MMEVVRTSETSVNFYETTQHKIPEDSHLQNGYAVAEAQHLRGVNSLE
jgi:hypothetical protein